MFSFFCEYSLLYLICYRHVIIQAEDSTGTFFRGAKWRAELCKSRSSADPGAGLWKEEERRSLDAQPGSPPCRRSGSYRLAETVGAGSPAGRWTGEALLPPRAGRRSVPRAPSVPARVDSTGLGWTRDTGVWVVCTRAWGTGPVDRSAWNSRTSQVVAVTNIITINNLMITNFEFKLRFTISMLEMTNTLIKPSKSIIPRFGLFWFPYCWCRS